MKCHYVRSDDEVRIATIRAGNPEGPLIVFIHGFCQSHYSFIKQISAAELAGFDILGYDLRGHGLSDKPVDPEQYRQSALWAADLRAVLDTVPKKRAVLVAWSYAGYIVGDYLSTHGYDRIAGINLVSAAIRKHVDVGHAIGPAFKTHVGSLVEDDLLSTLRGVRKLAIDCTQAPIDASLATVFESVACMTPHYVRRAMLDREVDHDVVWKGFRGEIQISHGVHDAVLLPEMAQISASIVGQPHISWFETGHSPFLESPQRFNAELREFVNRASRNDVA